MGNMSTSSSQPPAARLHKLDVYANTKDLIDLLKQVLHEIKLAEDKPVEFVFRADDQERASAFVSVLRIVGYQVEMCTEVHADNVAEYTITITTSNATKSTSTTPTHP